MISMPLVVAPEDIRMSKGKTDELLPGTSLRGPNSVEAQVQTNSASMPDHAITF